MKINITPVLMTKQIKNYLESQNILQKCQYWRRTNLNELMRTNSDLIKLLSYNKSLDIYILDEPKTYYNTYWLILKFIIYAEKLIYSILSDGKSA